MGRGRGVYIWEGRLQCENNLDGQKPRLFSDPIVFCRRSKKSGGLSKKELGETVLILSGR